MSTYVLVHGAWHGRWCWYKVVPLLERAGHQVITPDLPSLGADRTPIAQVSLRGWTDCIRKILDAQHEPVTLIGHSLAGIVISQVAEERPDKIRALVYLAALLLRSGESALQVMRGDGTSLVLPNLVVSEDQSCVTVRADAIRRVFYGDCSDEDITLAGMLLMPTARLPSATPVVLTDQRFGRVPRVFIECVLDNAIPLPLQRQMCANTPCQKIISMNTSHSPFLSAPEELVSHLISI
jgi:pimeloyl-ACP methyl ester carboxylesterase